MSGRKNDLLIVGLIVAILTLFVVWQLNLWSDMWANLVTELIGIFITVGWLDRRIKKREEEGIKPSVEYVYRNILLHYCFFNHDYRVLINPEKNYEERYISALSGIKHTSDLIYSYLTKFPEVIEINHRTKLDDLLQNLCLFEEVMIHNIETGEYGGLMGSYNEFNKMLNYEQYWELREELTEYYEKTFPEESQWTKIIKGVGKIQSNDSETQDSE